MDSDLKDFLIFAYREYQQFQATQRAVLLTMNTLALPHLEQKISVRSVSPSDRNLVIPRNPLADRPRGTQYVHTNNNIQTDEHEDLRFLPFEESSGRVSQPANIQLYSRTLFNEYQHSETIIENRQLADFLMLKLLFSKPNFDVPAVAEILKKSAIVIQDLKYDVKLHYLSPVSYIGTDVKELENKFCRVCKTIGCFMHFASTQKSEYVDPGPIVSLTEVQDRPVVNKIDPKGWKNEWRIWNVSVEATGQWMLAHRCDDARYCSQNGATGFTYSPSPSEKWIAKQLVRKRVFNPCILAELADVTCIQASQIFDLVQGQSTSPTSTKDPGSFFPSTDHKLNKPILALMDEPSNCCHGRVCPSETCLCLQVRKCCEKFCECEETCTKRFLGCNCQYGTCVDNSCICVVNNYECDPDVCLSCCAALHAEKQAFQLFKEPKGSTYIACLNTAIQNCRRKRTAIAKSTIPGAGYGMFSLEDIKSGEYITEYTGEMISSAEALRRGVLYDFKEHSYIFQLTSEQSLDATLMGNKMRYMNHKSGGEENCIVKTKRVMGNTKVVLYAACDIQSGSELFFDYGYKKGDVNFSWFVLYNQKLAKKKQKRNWKRRFIV